MSRSLHRVGSSPSPRARASAICAAVSVVLVTLLVPTTAAGAADPAPVSTTEASAPAESPAPDVLLDPADIPVPEGSDAPEGEPAPSEEPALPESPGVDDPAETPTAPSAAPSTPAAPAQPRAADLEIVPFSLQDVAISVVYDGTATFDADDAPGNDQGPDNGRVRTNDYVQYKFEYNTDGAVTDPYITSTAPAGTSWEAVPPTCTGAGTSPSPTGVYDSVSGQPGGDRRVLVCQLPSTTESVSDAIQPRIFVGGTPQNGTELQVSFSVGDASAEPPLTSDTASVVVSAAPFYDLRKSSRSSTYNLLGPNGEPGTVNAFPFSITVAHPTRSGRVDGIKGMAELADPITFFDDLSEYSPNSRLYTWGTGVTACGLITAGDTVALPASRFSVPGGANATNAVPETGVVSCSENGSGFDVTLTGTDTSGSSFPTTAGRGAALPANNLYVATGLVRIWTPSTDIEAANNNLLVRNTFSGFDPDDVTGQSNYGAGSEALGDCFGRPGESCTNTTTLALQAGIGFSKTYQGYPNLPIPPGASGMRSGDLRAGIGYKVRSRVQMIPSVLDAQNVTLCDVFDSTSQRLMPGYTPGNPPATFSQGASDTPTLPEDYVIEYGAATVRPATFADMRAARCDDADATWSIDPTDPALGGDLTVNGLRETIDRVRVRISTPLPAQTASSLYTFLEVYSTSTLDPANNPTGSIVSNFGQYKSGTTPTWSTGNNFDPVTFAGNAFGDRMRLVPGEVRLTKSLRETIPGSGAQVLAGQDATFVLQPSATVLTNAAPGILQDVVVTDVMPVTTPRLALAPLSATVPEGVSVEFCSLCDGTDWTATPPDTSYGVRWSFGDVETGTVMPELTFRARVPIEATNGAAYLNTASIASPDDPSTLAQRSSQASVDVVAAATILATKSTPRPIQPLDTELVWTLAVRNATTTPADRLDVVDTMPLNGDGRTPESSYSGGFTAIRTDGLPAGLTGYVTSSDPVVLDALDGFANGAADPGNPGDGWYVEPGTGIWSCTITEVGTPGCPTAAQVTAVRYVSAAGATAVLAPNETLSWDLVLTPEGNVDADIYTNWFVARVNPEVLQLSVSSPQVPIRVVAPDVSIAKDVCVAAECAADDEDAWAQTALLAQGGEASFRLTVTNSGTQTGDVVTRDVLPAGLELVDGSAVASQGEVDDFAPTWTVGSMEPGDVATLVFRATGTGVGEVTNTASTTITDRFDQTAQDTDDASVTLVVPQVTVAKEVTSSTVSADGTAEVVYALTVTNTSEVPGTYDLADELRFGDGITVTAARVENVAPGDVVTDEGWDGRERTTITTGTAIAAGASHTYSVVVDAHVPGGLTPEAAQCSASGDRGGFSNLAVLSGGEVAVDDTACVPVPQGAVTVTKTGPAQAEAGATITWSILVANTGDLDAGAQTVTDRLPTGVTFVSASEGGTAQEGTVTWLLDALPVGQSRTLQVTGTLDQALTGTSIENCATAGVPEGWVTVSGDPSCVTTRIPGGTVDPIIHPTTDPSTAPVTPTDPSDEVAGPGAAGGSDGSGILATTGAQVTLVAGLVVLLLGLGLGAVLWSRSARTAHKR